MKKNIVFVYSDIFFKRWSASRTESCLIFLVQSYFGRILQFWFLGYVHIDEVSIFFLFYLLVFFFYYTWSTCVNYFDSWRLINFLVVIMKIFYLRRNISTSTFILLLLMIKSSFLFHFIIFIFKWAIWIENIFLRYNWIAILIVIFFELGEC